MTKSMFPFAVVAFTLFVLFGIFALTERGVYGPAIQESEEIKRLIDEDKMALNSLNSSIVGTAAGVDSHVDFISKHNSRLYSRLPFVTEYRVAYFTGDEFINRRIQDGTELHKKVRELHDSLRFQ